MQYIEGMPPTGHCRALLTVCCALGHNSVNALCYREMTRAQLQQPMTGGGCGCIYCSLN